jgi:hypothetical protein
MTAASESGHRRVDTGRIKVKKVRANKTICKIETTVHNQAGKVCLSGTATVYTVPLAPGS